MTKLVRFPFLLWLPATSVPFRDQLPPTPLAPERAPLGFCSAFDHVSLNPLPHLLSLPASVRTGLETRAGTSGRK